MNQYIKYGLAVVIGASAMVAYQYEGKPEQAGLAQQAPIPVTEIKNDIAQVEHATRQEGVTKEGQRQNLGPIEAWEEKYGDAFDLAMAAHKAEFISKYEAGNVHPFNPLKVTCEELEVLNEAGESIKTLSCAEEYSLPRHPYYQYETSLLETLAYGDPLAAQIIADRIGKNQPLKALQLLLHAAAISEKPGPLMIAAHNTFSITNALREISEDDVYRHVALLEIAKVMGAEFGTELEKLPVEVDAATVEELVKEMKVSMAQSQITVSGSSSLKELFDV